MAGRWPGGIINAKGYGSTAASTLMSGMHSVYTAQQNRQAFWPKRDFTTAWGTATNSSANANSYTFSNINIGAPATNKYLYAMVAGTVTGASGVTNVTMGGSAFTQLTSAVQATSGYCTLSMWGIKVGTTSTSTSIVVTFGSTLGSCFLASFPMSNVSNPFVARHSTSQNINGSSTSTNLTFDVPAGSIGLCMFAKNGSNLMQFTVGIDSTLSTTATLISSNGESKVMWGMTTPSTVNRAGHTITATASSTTGCFIGASIL